MRTVGIRELKNKLSHYIRLVKRGDTLLVTDRGELVAEIRSPSRGLVQHPYPPLTDLARAGKLRMGEPNDPSLYLPRPVRMPDGTAVALIEEGRADR